MWRQILCAVFGHKPYRDKHYVRPTIGWKCGRCKEDLIMGVDF